MLPDSADGEAMIIYIIPLWLSDGDVTIWDLLLCFVGFFMPHVPLISLFFSCGLPSVSLCLSALFPPGLLLCSPPIRYLTWPPPSSLSSPVPRWFISVCVFGLCVSFTPCPVIVCLPYGFVCPCSCLLLSVPCSFWYVFWDFEFCILFCFALFPFVPFLSVLGFAFSFKIKLTFGSSLILSHVPCFTAFGSNPFLLSIPLSTRTWQVRLLSFLFVEKRTIFPNDHTTTGQFVSTFHQWQIHKTRSWNSKL